MMALVTVSAIVLRWLPHHGLPVLLLLSISTAATGAIYFTQRRRYNTSSRGTLKGKVNAETFAVLWTASATATLGGLGIVLILAG